MNIPHLKPNYTFPKLTAMQCDQKFAFEAKRAAMGRHIISRWGWDEDFQWQLHLQRYNEKPFLNQTKSDTPWDRFFPSCV
ncbi:hypothetical protein PsAD2_01650 [Pseudovibrio axinellae]|uniref:Uncharacterized protein n=1 Tax=Pseudovibrio axinellae TaxID=989403 RepID=A0A165ZF98_9HYPH|nr:hypothetical protein PsAD2_01650 [Pseudovibrio axinellae]SER39839.1 hypothetical protein SAMN05421798_109114 [Pseudovibrio axinellae]